MSFFLKRCFDIIVSLLGIVLFGWLILICMLVARLETNKSGLFKQERVGKDAKLFKVLKLRTMRDFEGLKTTVTTDLDPRITKFGRVFRKTKLDELPQLWNVLIGQMSLVGPRPDVSGFADMLEDEERIILTVRPGITGPASIYYKNEEEILAKHKDPEKYNREVLWPHKVKLNIAYIKNYSFLRDFYYIYRTLV